jgi:small subunit ribosomal protein S15Ae
VIVIYHLIFLAKGYIGQFEVLDDHRGGKIVVELIGRINKCGVISPRYDVAVKVNFCHLFNTCSNLYLLFAGY